MESNRESTPCILPVFPVLVQEVRLVPAEGGGTAGLALYSPRAFLQKFSCPFSLRHPNDVFTFGIRDKKDSGQKPVGTEMKVSSELLAY